MCGSNDPGVGGTDNHANADDSPPEDTGAPVSEKSSFGTRGTTMANTLEAYVGRSRIRMPPRRFPSQRLDAQNHAAVAEPNS